MFVRWKEYRRKRGRRSKSAQLCRSVRVDGRPRQVVVCHLGSVRPGVEDYHWARADFWAGADVKLAELKLDKATRTRIEKSLLAAVPRPSARSAADRLTTLGRLSKRFRRPP